MSKKEKLIAKLLSLSKSFTFEEAKRFKYWDIASTSTNPDKLWGSGLYRNLDDDMAIEFLKKAIDIKTDIDAFLSVIGINETDEEIYFK